jgi:hypothetical protein
MKSEAKNRAYITSATARITIHSTHVGRSRKFWWFDTERALFTGYPSTIAFARRRLECGNGEQRWIDARNDLLVLVRGLGPTKGIVSE